MYLKITRAAEDSVCFLKELAAFSANQTIVSEQQPVLSGPRVVRTKVGILPNMIPKLIMR